MKKDSYLKSAIHDNSAMQTSPGYIPGTQLHPHFPTLSVFEPIFGRTPVLGPGPLIKEVESWNDDLPLPTSDQEVPVTEDKQKETRHAYTFLDEAVKAMKDRAAQRDVVNGGKAERSMAATVAAFNGLTGRDLTEEEGWEFMILLKMVRGRQGAFRADDYVDGSAYFGLLGECASVGR